MEYGGPWGGEAWAGQPWGSSAGPCNVPMPGFVAGPAGMAGQGQPVWTEPTAPAASSGFGGKGVPRGGRPAVGAAPKAGTARKASSFDAEVAAAAAAAIERPAQVQVRRPAEPDFQALIHEAQAEAERRRHAHLGSLPSPAHIQSAQFEAASRRGQDQDLKQMIWHAQRKNVSAAQATAINAPNWSNQGSGGCCGGAPGNSGQAPGPGASAAGGAWHSAAAQASRPRGVVGEPLSYEDFLGNWVDLQGNPVLVYSTDAWQPRLMAAVTRPNRPDLQLSLRVSPAGGWICGNATLDASISSAKRLHWIAPDGRVSVWTRGRE